MFQIHFSNVSVPEPHFPFSSKLYGCAYIAQVVVVHCVFLEAFGQFIFKLDSNVHDLDGFLILIYSQTLRLYCHSSELCDELFCILNCCCREITCDSMQSVTESVGRESGLPVRVYEL